MENLSEAAPALLGSTWLKATESRRSTTLQPASSGCHVIDSKVLDGGFRYGEITSITGAKGTGKTTLTLQAVASHLLLDDYCEVAFVDTTGSLDLLRLRNVLAAQMRKRHREADLLQSGFMYRKKDVSFSAIDNVFNDQINSVLDRIKLMRVFDFTGLVEAVSEIGAKWERASNYPENETGKEGDERGHVIASSEKVPEEDEQKVQNNEKLPPSEKTPSGDGDNVSRKKSANMIVIDTIVNVVEVVMSQSRIQGQALMTTFLRSLQQLTSSLQICSIVTNAAIGGSDSISSHNKRRRIGVNASIFASNLSRPALGRQFSLLIDSSVLLSNVSGPGSVEPQHSKHDHFEFPSNAGLIEVLHDRTGSREGKWAAFEIIAGSEVKGLR